MSERIGYNIFYGILLAKKIKHKLIVLKNHSLPQKRSDIIELDDNTHNIKMKRHCDETWYAKIT